VSQPIEILALEADDRAASAIQEALRRHNRAYRLTVAGNTDAALAILEVRPVQLLLANLHVPGTEGFALLDRMRQRWPDLPVIVISELDTARAAVTALKRGAADYLVKPIDPRELAVAVDEVSKGLRVKGEARKKSIGSISFSDIIGDCEAMRVVYEHIATVRSSKIAVFVGGETGTGKELVTRAIHRAGPRAAAPFVALNCGAIPESLQESELFGHEKGAFTGAMGTRRGKFEQAQGGTLFLDEVGELSAGAQVRLLRVLQEGTLQRVGGDRAVEVDVRIVSATHRDLRQMVARGTFREDLYYRLIVYPIHVPPLREREGDVPRLVAHFLEKYARDVEHAVQGLSPEAQAALERYSWPGNVRELENVIHRAMLLATDGLITVSCLPETLRGTRETVDTDDETQLSLDEPARLSLAEAERRAIERALDASGGNVTRAAKRLGIARATIYRKMARLGVDGRRTSET
jgi:DNA-binding NtrC family response regulator